MPPTVLCGGACNEGMTFAYWGNDSTSTAATSPLAMRRFVASPEAETPSYNVPPCCRIRLTISSDVLPYLILTWQPVSSSNGLTQDFCVYPGHGMRSSSPSPCALAS